MSETINDYQIRRMLPEDAQGVVDCVRAVYGNSYVHPEFYRADEIVRLNEDEEVVSAVAADAVGKIVGHYALERPGQRHIAETGVAIVLPEHRHHQLMERMRDVLEQEAARLQLMGLFGHAVTNHTFSQQVDERFHEEPCAVSLGWSPRTFHNLAEPLPQRMTEMLYFKFLQKPGDMTVYPPDHHAAWCQRIYGELEVSVSLGTVQPAEGMGQIKVNSRRDLGRAVVELQAIGEGSVDTLAALTDNLAQQGIEAIFLELPLAQSSCGEMCVAAEQLGFSFSGIGPAFSEEGDVLRLQRIHSPLDPSLILVESEHSKALLAYVVAERDRVGST